MCVCGSKVGVGGYKAHIQRLWDITRDTSRSSRLFWVDQFDNHVVTTPMIISGLLLSYFAVKLVTT